MRILHVLDHSLPLHSGYAFRSAAILREQTNLGWEVIPVTGARQGSGSDGAEVVDGRTYHRTGADGAPWRSTPVIRELMDMRALERRIDRIASASSPDILHAHSPVLNALPAARVARRRGIPFVYEVRALWEDAATDHAGGRLHPLRYRVSRGLETRAMRRADALAVLCEGLRREIAARGIPESRITVVPNAIDPCQFRPGAPPDRDLKARLGLEGATVLGFLGSFYRYEGLDVLLEAMPRITAAMPRARLLLGGGGPEEAALGRQAERLGVMDSVRFLGRLPHADVGRYYDLIEVLVYPRRSTRTTELVTPLKPIEAMASGRIVLASDVGGHRELIRDGETGVLFRAGDSEALAAAVLETLARRDRWPRWQDAGRRYVETERAWPIVVRRYARIYEGLLGRVG